MNVYILKLKNNLSLNKEGNVARPEPVLDLGLWRKRLNMKTSQVCFSEKGTDYSPRRKLQFANHFIFPT